MVTWLLLLSRLSRQYVADATCNTSAGNALLQRTTKPWSVLLQVGETSSRLRCLARVDTPGLRSRDFTRCTQALPFVPLRARGALDSPSSKFSPISEKISSSLL